MSLVLFADFVNTQLAGPITNVATTANLLSGAGALLPTPANGQYVTLTLNDAVTGELYEIVHVTGRTGDTITMVRGQEGTTALDWSAGDLVFSGPTAGQQEVFGQILSYAGNPNGNVAGTAGSSSSPPTMCWDSANGTLWYCSQSGTASTAVWSEFFVEPFVTDSGSGNGVVVTLPSAPASLSAIVDVPFYIAKSNSASTGAVTINANGLGATSATMVDGTAFSSAINWPANAIALVVYDGTAFRILNFLTPGIITSSFFNVATYTTSTRVSMSGTSGNSYTVTPWSPGSYTKKSATSTLLIFLSAPSFTPASPGTGAATVKLNVGSGSYTWLAANNTAATSVGESGGPITLTGLAAGSLAISLEYIYNTAWTTIFCPNSTDESYYPQTEAILVVVEIGP